MYSYAMVYMAPIGGVLVVIVGVGELVPSLILVDNREQNTLP